VLFGGARGGGKTDGILGKAGIRQKLLGRIYNGVIFRQEMPQADDMIERAYDLFAPLGARFNKVQSQWTFADGGRLRFRPLETIQDAAKYQGQNLTDATIDEAGNYPNPDPIDRLWGALRGADVRLTYTANPGGAGAGWLKDRFHIDEHPQGMKIFREKLPNGAEHTRCFIPSKVTQNKALLASDPDYVNRLYLVGSKSLVRAWLEGDWNAIEGAFFDCWSPQLIISPFEIPSHWHCYRSFDWGSASPFSVGWWAVASEDYARPEGIIPRGALVRFQEWYGAMGPNKGLKLTIEEVAGGIAAKSKGRSYAGCVADPSIFAEDGGPSRAEVFRLNGVLFKPADNKRVGRNGMMGGWDEMRQRMLGNGERPMIYTFSTCKDSIRTIPILPHDQSRVEDIDTNAEDHAADEWRYACMARPWVGSKAAKDKSSSFNDYAAPKQVSDSSWL
jgi:hypothetical protein